MKRLLVIAILLAACGSAAPTPAATERPGSAEVYARIAALIDCKALQAEFDTASANGDRARAAGRPLEATTATAYMKAADARMRELRCY